MEVVLRRRKWRKRAYKKFKFEGRCPKEKKRGGKHKTRKKRSLRESKMWGKL